MGKVQVGEYAEITSGACRNIIGLVVRIDKGCVVLQVDAKTMVIAHHEDVNQVKWAKAKQCLLYVAWPLRKEGGGEEIDMAIIPGRCSKNN